MHPVLANPKRLLLYLACWLAPVVLLAYLFWAPGGLTAWECAGMAGPLCLFYAFVCLSPQYQCRFLPLQATPIWKLILNHGGAAALAALLWGALALFLARPGVLGRLFPGIEERFSGRLGVVVAMGILFYAIAVVVHYVLAAMAASRRAEVLARDAELRALKAQVNPHFLFNSLNSISALTAVDAARAREMCIRLAEFLRTSLGLGERTSVTWREEMDLVTAYLEVEKVRFGGRLRLDFQMEPGCDACRMPPLLLQPLIENAVKHGVSTLPEGGEIRLRARVNGDAMQVAVENPFDAEGASARRNGLGLRNVKGRLEARYGKLARFSTVSREGEFRVELEFPFRGEERLR